jgi:hypothetical protein
MMMKTTATNTRLLERKGNGRNERKPTPNGRNERMSITLYIHTHTLTIYFMDQFEIDFHIFTDIKIFI